MTTAEVTRPAARAVLQVVARTLAAPRAKAQEEKNEVTFDAEIKRCDSFAGDARDACEARVKQRFGRD